MGIPTLRHPSFLLAAAALAAIVAPVAAPSPARRGDDALGQHAVVAFRSPAALDQALALFPATVVRRIPSLSAVEVRPDGDPEEFAAAVSALPGISFSDDLVTRTTHVEPALTAVFRPGLPYEWQYVATRENEVPESVLRAASAVKIAVVDTGADVTHPDLAAKAPETWDIVNRRPGVRDEDGHGTFVSSLAAGSVTNGEGIAGFAGDAQLLVIKAVGRNGMFTDVDEAAAIVYAVEHGATVINLSLGGEGFSAIEAKAVKYAAAHDVLVVAAAGNEFQEGNPIEYPAAVLQPPGSNGQGGLGLSVAASTMSGKRAYFSNTGSQISLAAPGDTVFGGIAVSSSSDLWPRYALPGSLAGLYGWSSGTSFSTPQVAGAAALVRAANPLLTATQVAGILKATSTGHGRWNPRLGYGIIDVAAAVASASGQPVVDRLQAGSWLRLNVLRKHGRASHWRPANRLRPVSLSVWLRTSAPTVSPANRIVTVAVRNDHGHWKRLARQTTRLAGQIRWTVSLRPGIHSLRVWYGGRWDLRGASRQVRLRVPR